MQTGIYKYDSTETKAYIERQNQLHSYLAQAIHGETKVIFTAHKAELVSIQKRFNAFGVKVIAKKADNNTYTLKAVKQKGV